MNRKSSTPKTRRNAPTQTPLKRLQKVASRLERDTKPKRSKPRRRSAAGNNGASNLWTHLTSPTSTIAGYWPTDTRESLKMPVRMQFSLSVPASGSCVIFPTPSLTSETPSLSHVVDSSSAALWTSAGTLTTPTGTQTQTTRFFSQLPFSRESVLDGMSGRCTKFTVKLTYVGPLLNRAGTIYIYEEPNRDLFARNGVNAGTAFSSWLQECVDSTTNTRVVSVTKCPEVIADFHPILWKGDNVSPAGESAAWHAPTGVSAPVPGDNSSVYNGTDTFGFASATFGKSSRAPSAAIFVDNNTGNELEFRLDVIAHYEINGGNARMMSTPSPAVPSHICDTFKNALVRAKYHHVHSPHETFTKIANNALKDVMGGNGKQPKMTVGSIAKAGMSLAGLFI